MKILSLVLALIFPLLLVSPEEASARTGTRLTLSVNDTTPSTDDYITFSGRIKNGPVKNGVVKFQYYTPAGRWGTLSTYGSQGSTYTFTIPTPQVEERLYRMWARSVSGKKIVSKTVVVHPDPRVFYPTLEEVQAEVFLATNNYREQAGLSPLIMDPDMNTVALNWSKKMARDKTMSHNPKYGMEIPPNWKLAGENVAMGYEYDEVTNGWYQSPGHRDNILGDYTHIGIGYALDEDGYPYYTQVFGKY